MFRLLMPIVLSLLMALPARAESPKIAVQDVIRQQLDAFVADDVERAFTFASPMIKGLFGTPQNFGAMVRQGYPMVWRPGDVRFLSLEPGEGGWTQKVMITDQAGQVHVLEYQMVPAGEGWQINAVRILDAPPLAA